MCESNTNQGCGAGCNDACSTSRSAIRPETTVRELVLLKPRSVRLLKELGADTCCGAGKSMSEVAAQSGLGVDELIRQLSNAEPVHVPANGA